MRENTLAFLSGKTVPSYDYGIGQPSLSADLRGQYTIYSYTGSGYGIDRIEQVNHPNGGHTTYSCPTAKENRAAGSEQRQRRPLQTSTLTDAFGRLIETGAWDSYLAGGNWTNGWVTTQLTYDALGCARAETRSPARLRRPTGCYGPGVV